MASGSPVKIRFRGVVSCRTDHVGPLGLTLVGRTVGRPDEVACLSLTCAPPAGIPEALEEAEVERIDDHHYRITAGEREWMVSARAAHLHREVAAAFYQAIRPRPAPARKRLFWRLVLTLAARPGGLALLRMLRGRR